MADNFATIELERDQARVALARALEELRANKQKVRMTFDTLPGFVLIHSADGTVELGNQRLLEYLGMTLDEFKDRRFRNSRKIVHDEDQEATKAAWKRALETGEPFDTRHRLRRADGTYRWFHSLARPLRDSHENIVQWYNLSTDIDDRRKTEEALRLNQAALAHVARVASLGALTASIAHEVNKPFGAIVTNGHAGLRWLDREPPDLNEVRNAMERMINDGIRGSEIIERIRGLFKKQSPARQRLDLNELIHEISAMRHFYVEQPILRLELASGLAPVLADRVQLHQVLLNLIGNAVDAMKTIIDRPRDLCIRTGEYEPNTVSVAVQDTGVGVDSENLDRLFETFYTTKPDGLGMGLAISRSIVESHEGHLWAERNVGPGMTFRFSLPAQQESIA